MINFYDKIINNENTNFIDVKKSLSPIILNSNFIYLLIGKVNKDLNKIYFEIKNKLQYKNKIDSVAK